MSFSSPYQYVLTVDSTDSPVTVPVGVDLVLCDCTSGAITIDLYDPGTHYATSSPGQQPYTSGQIAVFKTDSSGNDVTVTTAAGAIVGPDVLADQGAGVTYTSDGSATWYALAGSTQSLDPTDDPTFDSVTLTNWIRTGFATTATAAGTTTLTVDSKQIQAFTGVTTQTVVLPVTSTLGTGAWYEIINNSSGVVTVQSSGANTVLAMTANSRAKFICVLASGTTAASWAASYAPAITITGTGAYVLQTSPTLTTPVIGVATGTSLAATGLISSSSPTTGIGYATGAGGAQTQLTDKSTTVVSNTITTAITMNNAALNAATTVSFTFTNSAIAATDTVICTHQSAGTSGAYTVNAFPGAGSAVISVRNNTAGNLSESIVLRVTVIKSVSA